MVNPDTVIARQADSITTPDILRVEVLQKSAIVLSFSGTTYINVNVLNNDVLSSSVEAKALAKQNTLVANTNKTLVATNRHADVASLVVFDLDRLLVAVAAARLDGVLASVGSSASTRQTTARLGDASLGTKEVKGLVNHDDPRGVVGQP
jgi:hypothetical protein